MRLFKGLFLILAGQALIATVVPGGLLLWNLHSGFNAAIALRDGDRLRDYAMLAAADLRRGTPLVDVARAIDTHDPVRLAGRVTLIGADGNTVHGPPLTIDSPPQQAILTNGGKTVGVARIAVQPTLGADDLRMLTYQYLALGAILAAMFAGLLIAGAWIAKRFSTPQVELARVSREVAQGDYDVAFPESGYAETAATMRNLGRVARQFDRLETARRTWLVSVAEELRKPSQTLGERLESLAQVTPPIDPALQAGLEQDRYVLSRMAEDLHAVALADLGRLPVTFAVTDPRALIHNAIWENGGAAKAIGVTLTTAELPEYTIPVKWDGKRIEQLFSALIENSLRYTPPGGRIVLGLQKQRSAWELIIDDSAPGVDVLLAQRLFEPFYRTTALPGESVTGSGLGLATARAIVEAHHGRIEASRSPIGGLRVTVVLPAAPPAA